MPCKEIPLRELSIPRVLARQRAHHGDKTFLHEQGCAQRSVERTAPQLPELPVSMNQKIDKFRLKQRMEAGLSSTWDRERAGIVPVR